MLKEMAFVLIFVKLGVDAKRVASDKEMEEGGTIYQKVELTIVRMLELCFE